MSILSLITVNNQINFVVAIKLNCLFIFLHWERDGMVYYFSKVCVFGIESERMNEKKKRKKMKMHIV